MTSSSLDANFTERIKCVRRQLLNLTDVQLSKKTFELKLKLQCGAVEEEILIQAFAVFCEAANRTLNIEYQEHQLLAGAHLHFGQMVELKTGGGKTLAIIIASYFNTLFNRAVHIIVPNNYLVFRDYNIAKKPLEFLKTTVGTTSEGMSFVQKKEAYKNSILYGTANEFLFDHLNDAIVHSKDQLTQCQLDFGVVDEADQILVDNSELPSILSTPPAPTSHTALQAGHFVRFLSTLTKENSVALYHTIPKADVRLTELGQKK